MEATYGPGTDPFPYIVGAYGLGGLVLIGFLVWVLQDRRRLRAMLSALDPLQKKEHHE